MLKKYHIYPLPQPCPFFGSPGSLSMPWVTEQISPGSVLATAEVRPLCLVHANLLNLSAPTTHKASGGYLQPRSCDLELSSLRDREPKQSPFLLYISCIRQSLENKLTARSRLSVILIVYGAGGVENDPKTIW